MRLLDHSRNEVALFAAELVHRGVALGFAKPGQQHLASGRCCDSPESLGRVVELTDLLAVVIDLCRPDCDVTGLAVEHHPRVFNRALSAVVRDKERGLDGLDNQIQREILLANEPLQCIDVDIHQLSFFRSNST